MRACSSEATWLWYSLLAEAHEKEEGRTCLISAVDDRHASS